MSAVWECGSCATCGELVAADELESGDVPEHPVIGVDVLDALELSEILDYIGEWLSDAPAAVVASLEDHGGGPAAREILVDALARHSGALTTTVAS